MELPKLIILLCCTYYSFASHYSHTIPVEGYETELQYLGQHVDIPETPVKVVKITKTVAVKIPVPYPVKVLEKVPYPVHVAKPYPVPVPQIIKVPHIVTTKSGHSNEATGSSHGGPQNYQGNTYNVEEAQEPSDEGNSYGTFPSVNSYNAGNSGYNHNLDSGEYSGEESPQSSYSAPLNNYFGQSNNNNFETNNYDQSLNQYLHNQIPNAQFGSSNSYQNH